MKIINLKIERKTYFNKKYDLELKELKEDDEKNNYLELDNNLFRKEINTFCEDINDFLFNKKNDENNINNNIIINNI